MATIRERGFGLGGGRGIFAVRLILLVWFIFVIASTPRFVGLDSVESMLWSFMLRWPFVLGSAILLTVGYFDLSMGGVAALAAVVVAAMAPGSGLAVALATGLMVGLLASLLLFFLSVVLRGNILLCGFGLDFVARGVALLISGGAVLTLGGASVPVATRYARSGAAGAVGLVAFVLVVLLGLAFLRRRWLPLRRVVQLGQSPAALSVFGSQVISYQCGVFLASGALVGIGGCVAALNVAAGSARMHPDIALQAIAACILGGMSFSGGALKIVGPTLGLFLIVALDSSLIFTGLSLYWRPVFFGLVVLAAAAGSVSSLRR